MEKNKNSRDEGIGKVPEDVVIEILVRGGIREWEQISCVKKQWASLFRCDCECFWQAALSFYYPHQLPLPPPPTWPVPLPNNSKRRFIALYISQHIFASDPPHEILGHTYLFLKDQLQPSIMPPHSGILHGTIIDQFIACGKSRDVAHELASRIWLAVVDNLDQNHHSFSLLKRLAHEGDVFLPYPYTRSVKVQWRLFEKLFTDFRDCFNHVDYYDMLGCAKSRFHPIPSAWLGY
ncbi:hypothetical protein AAZX31_08G221000 [Glycine max]|uniref:F-box domain-containing protein n=2 Tax=Glycine subgen. Soja TaxID=1462606 RepID=I1KVU2_SOYBN|nr:uncharacterized protein LOC100780876 isoform X1 [Glycine max]XP_028245191.1 uncharacterized protein LOC114422848 isoform X1 [Glycine soja]KAG5016449.1 hypothetical protein JHK85_022585 [Glycine max]KAG5026215.1 hypothetical protein JHK86_022129 [Glycine max]KAG5137375.1 hypothetical protein JHK82_022106 [Glycine max]KAH1052555.1 hypothetical protein GYH30_022067 [Glycine max]KAH1238160.1 hypothetical protein GmHk_08G022891 [Glycine max]|eukprot:XP_014634660.1 uncharacterized protein LOC100780876 isoform X1 [Glycine max]